MGFLKAKGKNKLFIITTTIVFSFAIIVGAMVLYLNDYYRADEEAVAGVITNKNSSRSVSNKGNVIFEPQNATCGFIFYPGGKVEHRAYEPLLAELAEEGVLCVLVKMPFNLAVFDIKAEADSMKARLQRKKQEVQERENSRQSHRHKNSRGAR